MVVIELHQSLGNKAQTYPDSHAVCVCSSYFSIQIDIVIPAAESQNGVGEHGKETADDIIESLTIEPLLPSGK
jgi:hypothetical protein